MITKLTVDNRDHADGVPPIGVGTECPRFGWRMESDRAGAHQTAYRLKLYEKGVCIWDSDVVESPRCHHIRCGVKLNPRTYYTWQVSVRDELGSWTDSVMSAFATGFFTLADWPTVFVTCKGANGDSEHPEPVHVRKAFTVDPSKTVRSAMLYTASTSGVYGSIPGLFQNLTERCNMYIPSLNGTVVTEERQNPGQVSHKKWRAYYRTYPITDLLLPGENIFGAVFVSMAFSACIYIQYTDGSEQFIGSDELKMNGRGPWRLWDDGVEEQGGKGEKYISACAYEGWDEPGYDASAWRPAIVTDAVTALQEQRTVTTIHQTLAPVRVDRRESGRYIFDFGENMNGNLRIRIHGVRRGTWVTIRHAEMLDDRGELMPNTTINFQRREPDAQTDIYFTRTDTTVEGEECYTPRFSMHGFRYAEVSGIEPLDAADVSANIICSPVGSLGGFDCSDERTRGLYDISRRTQRNNIVSIPTDCPHRERLGWLGDALCVAEAECLEWNMLTLLEDWFVAIRDDQDENGGVPYISPFAQENLIRGRVDIPWQTAIAEIPWIVYNETGDDTILRDNYPMLCRFIAFVDTICDVHGIPQNGVCWNDHTTPHPMNSSYLGALYFYRCLDLAAKIGGTIGEPNDYAAKAKVLRATINRLYYHDGTYADGLQSDIAHALYFGIAPEADAQMLSDKLAASLRETNIIAAGTLGIWVMIPVLAMYGHNDEVLRLARLTCNGSWGGWIANGDATTAFEYLDESKWMHFSHDHPFLMGSIHSWFYRELAGIRQIEPGYVRFSVKPYFPEDINFMNASVETPNGVIRVHWRRNSELQLDVPCGCEAEVELFGKTYTLGSGHHAIAMD